MHPQRAQTGNFLGRHDFLVILVSLRTLVKYPFADAHTTMLSDDNENVSLKLLSPNTGIHGSFTNLVDYLFLRGGAGEPKIRYLIGRKNSDDGEAVSQLSISDFMITRENFMTIMDSSNKNRALLGDEKTKNSYQKEEDKKE